MRFRRSKARTFKNRTGDTDVTLATLTRTATATGATEAKPESSGSAPVQVTTDRVLVERVQAGDRRSFDLLVMRYQQRIAALAWRYTRDQQDVADITQEALIRAYRALKDFRGDSEFYTWLYRITVNVAKNHLAAQGRRPVLTDLDDPSVVWPDQAQISAGPAAEHDGVELARVVRRAYDELPDDLREALRLREFESMSYEQIADTMKTPVGTVRSRIFRARDAIDRRVQAWRAGEGVHLGESD